VAGDPGAADEVEADAVAFLPPDPVREPEEDRDSLGTGAALQDLFAQYTDLQMRLRGRAEMGGDWTSFRPCDSGFQFTCNAPIIPRLTPELQFGLQVGGTVSERVHVNVDFDQTREFSAANNINVYYQGLEDEILQRLEVGDVSYQLPPNSRFLTEGIPAGNFGFQTTGQLGPVDFQAVWAQQKGDLSTREFQLSGAGGQQAFVQEDTLVLDDADYVEGQYFFLFDPAEIQDYPHFDILSLDGSRAPRELVPGTEQVQVYRFENDPITSQQVQGYIQADGFAEMDGDTIQESGWFRYLQPDQDYFVHPSGLWIALRSPLRRDEMLAVTYITATGDSIGDYNPERLHNEGIRPRLRLLKASGASHQPGTPTWPLEMHHVYRISGSNDVEVNSVDVTVSLGELGAGRTFKRAPTGEDITFLKLFGLDEESPFDRLDRAQVYRPVDDSFQEQPPVSGTFLVFRTLQPFLEPPPVPSLNLSADDTKAILGDDANGVIYESQDPVERGGGGVFRLTIPFRVRSEGLVSTFNLGALGIRDGSERIYLGERRLEPRVDYIAPTFGPRGSRRRYSRSLPRRCSASTRTTTWVRGAASTSSGCSNVRRPWSGAHSWAWSRRPWRWEASTGAWTSVPRGWTVSWIGYRVCITPARRRSESVASSPCPYRIPTPRATSTSMTSTGTRTCRSRCSAPPGDWAACRDVATGRARSSLPRWTRRTTRR
jgi:hypothetical protein